MNPSYDLREFIKACAGKGLRITIRLDAINTAREDFNLNQQRDIMGFIANDGLEKLEFDRSKILEKNPHNSVIMVDSWSFFSGNTRGYLAFYRAHNSWIIKSFKRHLDPGLRHLPFKLLQTTDGDKK